MIRIFAKTCCVVNMHEFANFSLFRKFICNSLKSGVSNIILRNLRFNYSIYMSFYNFFKCLHVLVILKENMSS